MTPRQRRKVSVCDVFNYHGSRSIFMVFHGSRFVFHGLYSSRLVFHGFSPE